ncbi:hypothetical protein LSCM1_06797 [Leishmania martiniquensis]|uniref:Uncharacterized protein n=1 Tax=Leishmania martiniquensis TaxID=1580590 RepID=A0A836KNQ0_9TRYP|nr:hypothetical protein LSCM1_06797 [Leishmania martiniquensis]
MAAPAARASHKEDTASANDSDDDAVAFVIGDGQHTMYFSRSALMRHTPFFCAYFTERTAHAAAAGGGGCGGAIVMLRHVQPRSAEAALRLCHSAHHADDELFWSLQRECETADAALQPEKLRAVLSLYSACVTFELHAHAKAVSATVANIVTAHTVYDVLKTCARYTTTLLPETQRAAGLDMLLAACHAFVRVPAAWQSERRWRRLLRRYPELLERVAAAHAATAASAAASTVSSAHGESSTIPVAGFSPPSLRRVLLSPQKDAAATAVSATAVPQSAAPLPDVFAEHLRQTEDLALAAQWRYRTMAAEVAALRESCTALENTARRDEAAAAELALYLGEVRVYVQALRSAEAEAQQLCAAAAAPSLPTSPATLHELRCNIQCASARAAERKAAVDELIVVEQDALCELDAELARLRLAIC